MKEIHLMKLMVLAESYDITCIFIVIFLLQRYLLAEAR